MVVGRNEIMKKISEYLSVTQLFVLSFILPESEQKRHRQKGKKKKNQFKSNSGASLGGAVVESLPANAGDTGSGPGLGRSHMPRSS